MIKILNRPITVLMFHLMLAAVAVFAFLRLPVELTPEVDFPRLSVVTQWGQSSSEMVVRNITLHVEEAASSIEHVKNVSSTSSEGRSVVNAELDKDVDVNFVRLELLEKLSAIRKDLPTDASFPAIQKYVPEDFSSLQGFLSYNLFGEMSLAEVQKYAEENIKPALLGIKGVGAVRILGGAERQIYILLDKDKMQSLGITLGEVLDAIKNNTSQQTIGSINEKNKKYFVLTGKKIFRADDLKNITVGNNSTGQLTNKLGSIAQIKDSLANPISYVRIDGKPSVSIEIDREPGTNMLELASEVDSKILQIKKSLPSSFSISKIFDKSKDMRAEISELSNKVIISVLVIFFAVLLFFRNIFLSLVIVSSVAFSVAGGVIFLSISSMGLNVLTLAAIALSLGIVIDNNVVVVENVHRFFEEENSNKLFNASWKGLKPLSRLWEFVIHALKGVAMSVKPQPINETINQIKPHGNKENTSSIAARSELIGINKIISISVNQIKLPLIAAALTSIGALVPVFFLPEELKPYFVQFAETTAVILAFSILVAFAFVPVSLLILIKFKLYSVEQHKSSFAQLIQRTYIKIVNWIVLHKKTAVFIAVWFLGFPVWLLPSSIDTSSKSIQTNTILKSLAGFYNSTIGSDFYINIRPYVDYSLGGATQLFFNHVYKGELWNFGNETYLVFYIQAPQGTPVEKINEFTKQVERSLLPDIKYIKLITARVAEGYANIRVDFPDSIANTAVPYIIKNRLTSIAAQTGGFDVSVSGFGPGYYSGGESAPNFQIEIKGYNYNKVKEIAELLNSNLKDNPRVDNIKIDRLPWQSEDYQVLAKINRTALNRFGINVSDFIRNFSSEVTSNLSGFPIEIYNEPVNTIVKYNDYENTSTSNLFQKEILLNKKMLKLGGLINLNAEPVMPVIERDNQQYSRYVTFDFKGPYKYGDEFTDAVIKSINLPPGYELKRLQFFFKFGKKEALPLTLLGFLSVLIVFMVTASLYESYKKPFIIILSVPMSLIGLFSIFYLADANFGRGGYASILFLIGLAVNHGILLVDRIGDYDFAAKFTDKMSRAKMVAEASSLRLRPILITTIVTVAGFLPFVISADIYSFWYPFALGIIGGVAISTIMILFFMPAMYELISGRKHK